MLAHAGAEVHFHEFIVSQALCPLILLVLLSCSEPCWISTQVQATPMKRLCRTHNIITVNGRYPGPTLAVRNGDTLVVNVVNRAKYNVTLHWYSCVDVYVCMCTVLLRGAELDRSFACFGRHGVRQMRTAWADGPEFVTQCPIRPGGSYRYRFRIEEQEGTMWWHAHSSWLRATVHGALIVYPKRGSSYPFPHPNTEFPVILGTNSLLSLLDIYAYAWMRIRISHA